jgi:hypothetical protein
MPTTNNNWPTPVATDLVKDGWEAIKDLGDAIDTTLGVYSPATPMGVHLSTVTFSGVSSQSVNDVFSATYTNYRILFELVASTDISLRLRLRVSGADETAANYQYQGIFGNSTTVAAARSTGQTSFEVGSISGASRGSYSIDMFNPFNAIVTTLWSEGIYNATNMETAIFGERNTLASSFTGFTFFPNTGTITGSVSVYGYNK